MVCALPKMFGSSPVAPPTDRLAFARWLVNGRHPLVARVVVNRLCQGLFGEGIVRTPDYFGLHGDQPTHPELLDWLACEFVESGREMKQIHQLIVTSATSIRANRASTKALALDPKNVTLLHAPRLRLAAEQLRDQALAVGGLLEPSRAVRLCTRRSRPAFGNSAASKANGPKAAKPTGIVGASGYHVAENPVPVRDPHVHLLGIDRERFSFLQQGLEMRLTGVEKARVVQALIA